MSTQASTESWDHSVDFLIVGTGAGAMVSAIYAHDHGAKVLLLEKTELYGGNSAMSGGAMWIPCNPQMAAAGVQDSPEDALEYLLAVTKGLVAEDRLKAYLETAPKMLDYVVNRTHLRMQCMLTYTDYYPDAPGGKPGGRSLEPEHFHGRELGDEFERLRPPAVQELIMNRMSMTATEAHHLLARHPGWIKLTAKIMARYWSDVSYRTKSKRDRVTSLGNALIAPLRRSLLDRDVPLWLGTAAKELIVKKGRIVGIVAERAGKTLRIEAKRGVLLAAGGFESNPEMRKKYLPNPTDAEWTTGSRGSTGDAITMGMDVGAGIDLMDEAWWGPTSVVPGEDRARMLVVEKGLPGCILVDKNGKRFVNEAAPYVDIVQRMQAVHSEENPTVPAYMVFDATYRSKYPCGPFLQASQQPDWVLPSVFKKGYLKKAATLRELAGQLGVDAAGLEETVRAFNENAQRGTDPDFGRGEGLFDRYYGDERVKPNPCLAPLDRAPYYGILAYPGELGTKGGLKTDARGRVLTDAGEVLMGLYAIGNCSASVMGPTYPGAGATIGPAATFGYIVAKEVTGG